MFTYNLDEFTVTVWISAIKGDDDVLDVEFWQFHG